CVRWGRSARRAQIIAGRLQPRMIAIPGPAAVDADIAALPAEGRYTRRSLDRNVGGHCLRRDERCQYHASNKELAHNPPLLSHILCFASPTMLEGLTPFGCYMPATVDENRYAKGNMHLRKGPGFALAKQTRKNLSLLNESILRGRVVGARLGRCAPRGR